MPSMYVNVPKLPQETKDTLVPNSMRRPPRC